MPIITISRELGSIGTLLAVEVAKRFKAHCVDKEVMAEVARQSGVPEEVVVAEEERLLSHQMIVGEDIRTLLRDTVNGNATVLNEVSYVEHMTKAIEALAAANENIIFIGRGAQMILSNRDKRILHTHIYAPREFRIKRLQHRRGIPDYDEARQIIHQADVSRRDWYRRFFTGANWKDPRYYHLMINMSRIPVGAAVDLIAEAAESRLSDVNPIY